MVKMLLNFLDNILQERHPIHDRERITIFLNYHEEITPESMHK